MQIDFIKDVGFRLSHRGKSIILASSSISKPNAFFSDKDIINFAKTMHGLHDDIQEVEGLPNNRVVLTPAEPPVKITNEAYKFTDDTGLAFWRAGSIKLNPPATYLKIENTLARDIREGRGLLYLKSKSRAATLTSMSGFNSLIICTSSDARRSERLFRKNKFGKRIIKIVDIAAFANRIAECSNATDFMIRDVTYSDAKAVKADSEFPDRFLEVNGIGDLKESTLAYIAENWLEDLIRLTASASIFTKPVSYYFERERRFQFSFATDMPSPIVIKDASLAQMIEVIE